MDESKRKYNFNYGERNDPSRLIGGRFGNLTVIEIFPYTGKNRKARCTCECGKEIIYEICRLRDGTKTSCGCVRIDKTQEFVGKKFSKLEVLSVFRKEYKKQRTKLYALCLCECGNEKEIQLGQVIKCKTKSCGCAKKCSPEKAEKLRKARTIHGKYYTNAYTSWRSMIDRCYNVSNKSYSYYGGRGIKVCKRWRQSPTKFIEDLGERPSGMTLDRIDSNGNYTPKNCRWADRQQQAENRRMCIYVDFEGKKITLKELSTQVGVAYLTILSRYHKGWPSEKLTKKTKQSQKK